MKARPEWWLPLCVVVAACGGEATSPPDGCAPAAEDGAFAPFDSAGIQIVPLDAITVFETCLLRPTLEIRLGEIDGEGIALGDAAAVKYDPASGSYVVAWSGVAEPLDVFDADGRYTGSIGRVGQGPGEFPLGPSRFFIRNGLVTVYGFPTRTWTTFRLDGSVVGQRMIDVPPQDRVVEVGPDLVLQTSSASLRAGSVLVDALDLEVVGELPPSAFGVVPGGRPYPRRAVTGREPASIVTLAYDSLAIHEVDLTGRLAGMIRGEPVGFPVVGEDPQAGEPPPTTIRDVAFDGSGRLWLVTGVPAETWRDFRAAMSEYGRSIGATNSGPMEISMDVISSMPPETAPRIDVFDLERGLHLGSWVSDERIAGLMDRNGEVLVHQLEIDETGTPRLAVYRMF